MNHENDPFHSLLEEWRAPQPSSSMDARVFAAYRTLPRPSLGRRIWTARVTLPVPVLAAALLLIAAALWVQFRPVPPGSPPVSPPAVVNSPDGGYTTRMETAGFKPLPDGATRVVRSQVRH